MNRIWLPRTLRGRLVIAAAGSILAAVAVYAVVTLLLVSHELNSSLDRALRQRAGQVSELAVSDPAVLTNPGALESPISGRQIVVEVIDAKGRIIARSLTLGASLLPLDRLARAAVGRGVTGYENVEIGGRRFRLYAAPIPDAFGPAAGGAVLVASDTTDIANTTSHLALLFALIGAGAALLATLTAAALTGRGLRRLRRLAVAAGEIERTADLSRRLPQSSNADEVAQLSGVLNRMLDALEHASAGERRFLADASHELRTPVTTLLGNVEYAVKHGADGDVLADVQRDAARLARLVDDLLVLERVGAPASGADVVELDELAVEAVREHGARVTLERVEQVRVRGEREALRRALDNLIENALVHGPAEGSVRVSVTHDGEAARLTVRDQGPGPAAEHRDRLFQRFWRGPGAAERPGSGLGLSIVAAIVERHGGRVLVDGPSFTVELPAVMGGFSLRSY